MQTTTSGRRSRAPWRATSASVPVCVQGADLPSADLLPPSLAPLVERQGTKLGDASWHDDVERLVRRLEGRPPRRRTRTLLVAAAVGVLALVGVAIALALQDNDEPSLSEPEQRLVSSITGAAPAPDACGPRSSTAPEADASVNCGPAAHVVTEYHQFPTPEAAQRWFDQAELSADGAGDCAPNASASRCERRPPASSAMTRPENRTSSTSTRPRGSVSRRT